jgi:hypothetical protein
MFAHLLLFFWHNRATRARADSFLRFLNRTWHTIVGRTSLNEGSARRRNLYLTTSNSHKRQTSMLPAGFELRNSSKRSAANPCLKTARPVLSAVCVTDVPYSALLSCPSERTAATVGGFFSWLMLPISAPMSRMCGALLSYYQYLGRVFNIFYFSRLLWGSGIF